jgi:hypothetical protein
MMDKYAVRIFDSELDLKQGNKNNSRRVTLSTGGKDLINVLARQDKKSSRVGIYQVKSLLGFLPFQRESKKVLSLQELRELVGIADFAWTG